MYQEKRESTLKKITYFSSA